jgi:lipopolysaccharide transport system ATP-binding protein
MTTVIAVENLSKVYRLGQIGTGTFSNDIKLWWAKVRGKPNPLLRIGETDHGNMDGADLWALKDVSFTVKQGEVLGIIGKNGAGKSTILKILSRVTAPTSGRVKVKGRIASLLEVGTGFHPELTGRENTYLNGAILGMSRQEIDRKFDEIVDFSGVETFIDTPVKRYSSGMYVRLAFAVAAHLEPEILVVDEVLAVGDAEFQRKCLGKMGEVAREGRTVLFVSHNMDAIEKLCPRVLLLQAGMILADDGKVRAVIDQYLSTGTSDMGAVWKNTGNEFENKWFKPVKVMLLNGEKEVLKGSVRNDEEILLRIEGDVLETNQDLTIGYYCYSEKSNYPVYLSQFNDGAYENWPEVHKGKNVFITNLPRHLLNEGIYYIKPYVILKSGQNASTKIRLVNPDDNKLILSISVSSVSNESPNWLNRKGVIAPILSWKKAPAKLRSL